MPLKLQARLPLGFSAITRFVTMLAMTAFIRFVLLCLMAGSALAQSSLPPCRGDVSKWSDCFGSAAYPNGDTYHGEFKDGKFHGTGVFASSSGSNFVGSYILGKRNGLGVITFKSWHPSDIQHKFVGIYKDDQRNGQGVLYDIRGNVISVGIWSSDVLINRQAIDLQKFPYVLDSPTGLIALTNSSERPTAQDFDAERRKRQELQAELERAKELAESRLTERPRPQNAQRSERRVALIIGNAQYKSSPLDNSVNDATDINQSLKRFGFQTTFLRNASLGQMREATRRFADQLTNADVALIYFAGHGIESKNKNYMIPVNADLKFEYELADQAYDASAWLEMLEMIKSNNAERVNIVILDACRNNNLIGSRSLNRGLGRMDAPAGTFLSYSTAPGKVAADGGKGERNSPFTKNLLKAIQQPGQPIEEVFKEVRRNVTRETNGAQVPWESTSLTGFFSFRQKR